MTLAAGLRTPGRPGVFLAPAPPADRLRPERLDVAGFVGVALRGPVDQPVPITRWSEYVDVFGGFERPAGGPERLLPHAVSVFFGQGGRLAHVLRVAPHPPPADRDHVLEQPWVARAAFRLPVSGDRPGPLLVAADEGEWGNALHVRLRHEVTQRVRAVVEGGRDLRLPGGTAVTGGTLLRLADPLLPDGGTLAWVEEVDVRRLRGVPLPVRLDRDVAVPVGTVVAVDVVTGALDVDDRSAPNRGGERLTGLGLRADHPRWLATALADGRHLVVPADDDPPDPHAPPLPPWRDVDLTPARTLAPVDAVRVAAGADRSHLVDQASFFEPGDPALHPLDEDTVLDQDPHVGVDAMARVRAIGLLCVPDLTWRSSEAPWATPPASPPARRPRVPRRCCDACDSCAPGGGEADEVDLTATTEVPRGLDARDPDDLREIVERQQRLVATARLHERFVALLDVPDGLSAAQVADWRAGFDSAYAAAYHPWLAVARGDGDALAVPPSAFAAGIIAERELRLGLPWGPANELARDAVRAEAVVTDTIHDRLHQLGVNVFRGERDGFRLSAGRTLSSDPDYRQLSVRRLMTMLRLSIEEQTQWLAFEPHDAELRERLTRVLTGFLRQLNRRGAFAGATEAESFFVRCGDDVNPPSSLALGRLVAEIGVAPSAPLEYVMVRIARDVDGSLAVVGDEG